MGFRSYILAGLADGSDRDGVVRVVNELEGFDEVVFAEPVVGAYDLVVTIETDSTIEELISRMEKVEGIKALTALKVDPLPVRERMWKNIDGIPLKS